MLPRLIVLALFAFGVVAAQQPAQPSSPIYTAAQADAGRTAYSASCSGCHLPDLKGSFEAPQLAGSNFVTQWGDKTVAELQTYLMASMPPTDPGAPGAQAMTNIIAFMLQANSAPAGSQPLTPQAAASIRSAIGASGGAPERSATTPALGQGGRGGRGGGGGGDAAPVPVARKGLTVPATG